MAEAKRLLLLRHAKPSWDDPGSPIAIARSRRAGAKRRS
jgi:hypothetical protein